MSGCTSSIFVLRKSEKNIQFNNSFVGWDSWSAIPHPRLEFQLQHQKMGNPHIVMRNPEAAAAAYSGHLSIVRIFESDKYYYICGLVAWTSNKRICPRLLRIYIETLRKKITFSSNLWFVLYSSLKSSLAGIQMSCYKKKIHSTKLEVFFFLLQY